MAISDEYVVRWLLQDTVSDPCRLHWRMNTTGDYTAIVNGVGLKLCHCGGRTDWRIFLILERNGQQTTIEEPRNSGIFSRRYATDDDGRMADLMRKLRDAVVRRYALWIGTQARQAATSRQSIFRQLLFSENTEQRQSTSAIFLPREVGV